MEYKIRDKIGPRAIVKEDGQKVFDAINAVLESGERVTLDFEGVSQFASPFFNYAIGQLLINLTIDDLKQRLQITHLTPDGMTVVERVIKNASKYHTDEDHRRIVDAILEEQAKESD